MEFNLRGLCKRKYKDSIHIRHGFVIDSVPRRAPPVLHGFVIDRVDMEHPAHCYRS
jgi:hypothetical protein